jgi:uncharacterized protein YbjT (DUF2867 family)
MFVIAGVTGKTGRVVAESLLRRGERVRVLVRGERAATVWRAKGAEASVLSLEQATPLSAALRGASGFYTLLPEDPIAADFSGQRRAIVAALAAAVEAARVPHVVLLSALAVGADPPHGPAADLRYAELLLRTTCAKLSVLRASYFQENVLSACAPAQRHGVYPNFFGSPDFTLTTNATCDLGELATDLLLEPPARSETVDVVGPTYSVRQLAQHLGNALGVSLRVVEVPAAQQVEVLCQSGLSRSYATALAQLFACFREGRVSPRDRHTVHVATGLSALLPTVLDASMSLAARA